MTTTTTLDRQEIQGLVASGFGKQKGADFLLLTIRRRGERQSLARRAAAPRDDVGRTQSARQALHRVHRAGADGARRAGRGDGHLRRSCGRGW